MSDLPLIERLSMNNNTVSHLTTSIYSHPIVYPRTGQEENADKAQKIKWKLHECWRWKDSRDMLFNDLVLERIFTFLDLTTLVNSLRVCRKWNQVSARNDFDIFRQIGNKLKYLSLPVPRHKELSSFSLEDPLFLFVLENRSTQRWIVKLKSYQQEQKKDSPQEDNNNNNNFQAALITNLDSFEPSLGTPDSEDENLIFKAFVKITPVIRQWGLQITEQVYLSFDEAERVILEEAVWEDLSSSLVTSRSTHWLDMVNKQDVENIKESCGNPDTQILLAVINVALNHFNKFNVFPSDKPKFEDTGLIGKFIAKLTPGGGN